MNIQELEVRLQELLLDAGSEESLWQLDLMCLEIEAGIKSNQFDAQELKDMVEQYAKIIRTL